MGLYDDLQGVVNGIMPQFKQGVVVLNRLTFASPEVTTPWLPGAQTTTSYTLNATVQGVKKEHLAESVIQASDLLVTCAVRAADANGAAVDIDPRLEDVLTINGIVHEIKMVKQVPPSGTPVVFFLFARG